MSSLLPPESAPAQPSGGITRPRFVVRRGGGTSFEPLVGTTKTEVQDRLDREVTSGQVQEIDLYEYAGTVKVKRTSEIVNVFEDKP